MQIQTPTQSTVVRVGGKQVSKATIVPVDTGMSYAALYMTRSSKKQVQLIQAA